MLKEIYEVLDITDWWLRNLFMQIHIISKISLRTNRMIWLLLMLQINKQIKSLPQLISKAWYVVRHVTISELNGSFDENHFELLFKVFCWLGKIQTVTEISLLIKENISTKWKPPDIPLTWMPVWLKMLLIFNLCIWISCWWYLVCLDVQTRFSLLPKICFHPVIRAD